MQEEFKIVGIGNGRLYLQAPDGRTIAIPLEQLTPSHRDILNIAINTKTSDWTGNNPAPIYVYGTPVKSEEGRYRGTSIDIFEIRNN